MYVTATRAIASNIDDALSVPRLLGNVSYIHTLPAALSYRAVLGTNLLPLADDSSRNPTAAPILLVSRQSSHVAHYINLIQWSAIY